MKKAIFITSIILNMVFLSYTIYSSRYKIEAFFVKKYKIVFFGDSITNGGNWRELLHRHDIRNSGLPGLPTRNLLFAVNNTVIGYKPDTCYLMAGINDILMGVPIKKIDKNYTSIIDTLLKHKITPIIESTLYTTTDSINYSVDTLNNYLIALAKTRSIRYIDINKLYSKNHLIQAKFTADGLHLKKESYTIWANALK
jgi:lysophospholipase L1-like esterase